MRRWKDEAELGALLVQRGNQRRRVSLSPETAIIVGAALLRVSAKPTRDEVALAICTLKCPAPCYACMAQANSVVALYGCRLDSVPLPDGAK